MLWCTCLPGRVRKKGFANICYIDKANEFVDYFNADFQVNFLRNFRPDWEMAFSCSLQIAIDDQSTDCFFFVIFGTGVFFLSPYLAIYSLLIWCAQMAAGYHCLAPLINWWRKKAALRQIRKFHFNLMFSLFAFGFGSLLWSKKVNVWPLMYTNRSILIDFSFALWCQNGSMVLLCNGSEIWQKLLCGGWRFASIWLQVWQ